VDSPIALTATADNPIATAIPKINCVIALRMIASIHPAR
jgi:hypothetical protein